MRKALPVAGPSLLVFVLLGGNATAQPAREWLERMNRAVDELNYSGTFVHVLDGTPDRSRPECPRRAICRFPASWRVQACATWCASRMRA